MCIDIHEDSLDSLTGLWFCRWSSVNETNINTENLTNINTENLTKCVFQNV